MKTQHARVPGREEAAPGVLAPARGADVQVHVVRPQADPVHGREVADRVALVRVQHELGLGGRARGEIEQQRVVHGGRAVGGEDRVVAVGLLEGDPAGGGAADADAAVVARQIREFRRVARTGDDVAHVAALQAVAQVVGRQQRRRRDHDHPHLDGRQHEVPERHLVAEHHQQPVAAPHPDRAHEVGHPVGALRHLGEGQARLRAVFLDHPEGRARVAGGHGVEVVQRPVEVRQRGPAEVAVGRLVIVAVPEQEIARLEEGLQLLGCHHVPPNGCRVGFCLERGRVCSIQKTPRGVKPAAAASRAGQDRKRVAIRRPPV